MTKKEKLFEYLKVAYEDINNLCVRLQDDFSGVPFVQYEEDHLVLGNLLDLLDEVLIEDEK